MESLFTKLNTLANEELVHTPHHTEKAYLDKIPNFSVIVDGQFTSSHPRAKPEPYSTEGLNKQQTLHATPSPAAKCCTKVARPWQMPQVTNVAFPTIKSCSPWQNSANAASHGRMFICYSSKCCPAVNAAVFYRNHHLTVLIRKWVVRHEGLLTGFSIWFQPYSAPMAPEACTDVRLLTAGSPP